MDSNCETPLRPAWTTWRSAVAEARTRVKGENTALPVLDAVLALLDRKIAGDEPSKKEWGAAMDAAAAWSPADRAPWAPEPRTVAWRAAAAGLSDATPQDRRALRDARDHLSFDAVCEQQHEEGA